MKLVWSNIARQELVKLRIFSIENWGNEVAVRYMCDIRDGAKQVAATPERARLLRGNLRILRIRSHYLIFQINNDLRTVVVARVLHAAMDIEKHLP